MLFGLFPKKKNNDNIQSDNQDSTSYDQYEKSNPSEANKGSYNMYGSTYEQEYQWSPYHAEQQPHEKMMPDLSSERETRNTANAQQAESRTARLMTLIGDAIEKWAKEYHMESMPKSIIFGQALDAMRAMEPLFKNNQTEYKK